MASDMRRLLVQYMRDNPGLYQDLIGSVEASKATSADEISQRFKEYLANLSKSTTFVESSDVRAFTRYFNVKIQVYSDFTTYDMSQGPEPSGAEPVEIEIGNQQDIHFVPVTDLY
jgi:hypothetical protein